MRRIPTPLSAFVTCAALAVTMLVLTTPSTGSAAAPVAARVTTTGQVGAYSFPNLATCGYSDGRLSKITFPLARAAGRSQWNPTGQYVLWGARLQSRIGSGVWRNVGGTHFSDAKVLDSGPLETLKATSIPRIFGQAGTSYRVVQTIIWYFNNRRAPIVQGQARLPVSRYDSGGRRVASCAGTTRSIGSPPATVRNDELDAVRVSFARAGRADATYRLSGALPRGLRLNTDTGVVRGTVSATATDVTTNYKFLRSRTFSFTIVERVAGRATSRSYRWVVVDTAFRMQNYFDRYGCGNLCQGNDEPVRNISRLGPKLSFGCSDDPHGLPAGHTNRIYRQDYQKENGGLADSTGRIFRYGDVFRWWYYPCA